MPLSPATGIASKSSPVWLTLVCAAGVVGLSLLLDSIRWSSATYDEVAYLRVGARWWRTGERTAITRMGSPLTFWKLQQIPVLWILDRLGRRELIEDPIGHQRELLPLVRAGALWIWLAALLLCACWSRRLYGPRAMALAAWLFVLSPNLIAHGGLATMELPLLASTAGMLFLFWLFLNTGRRRWFWASAGMGGLAFSCKFTTVLIPPILGVIWWYDGSRRGAARFLPPHTPGDPRNGRLCDGASSGGPRDHRVRRVAAKSINGRSSQHQSELWGRVGKLDRPTLRDSRTPGLGWGSHSSPSSDVGRVELSSRRKADDRLEILLFRCPGREGTRNFLGAAGGPSRTGVAERQGRPDARRLLSAGDRTVPRHRRGCVARNYGFRYLLPLAPLAIVWISRLAEDVSESRGILKSWPAWLIGLGMAGQALAVAAIHPFELTYFNVLAGGPLGGRHVLSDSNLDWGQGLKSLARLQREEPMFRDLTLYYFGDTDPAWYEVEGTAHVVNAVLDQSQLPSVQTVTTRYLAVSASLQWGPWGPPGFFRRLDSIAPLRMTGDTTIAIYRTADLRRAGEAYHE